MAGPKSKIANLIEELLAEVPEVAQRWFESLNFPEGVQAHLLTPEYVKKLKNLGNEFPEGFRQYEPLELHESIDHSSQGLSDLVVINPEDYTGLASRSIEDAIQKEMDWIAKNPGADPRLASPEEHVYRLDEYENMYETGQLFDELPSFKVDPQVAPLAAQIWGHSGRHRNLAQSRMGAKKALIRIFPGERANTMTRFTPKRQLLSEVDPKTVLHTELGPHQSADQGGGKKYKSIEDTLKFMSLGALGGLYDGPIETGYLNNGT
jgi:hypothetical protein